MADSRYDWAALYGKHRDAMHRVARQVLRGSGRVDLADDAVSDAVESLMKKPPSVPPRSWEALLVATAKRRAIDIMRSSAIKTGVAYSEEYVPGTSLADQEDALEWLEKLSRARPAIARLDRQEQFVFVEHIVRDRLRADVAAALGVSPSRVSQITTKVLMMIRTAVEEGA